MTSFIRIDFDSQEALDAFLEDFDERDAYFTFYNPMDSHVPSSEAGELDLDEPVDELEQPFAIFAVEEYERDKFVFHLGAMKMGQDIYSGFTIEWNA